jgi:hypothetical protein
MTRVREDLPRAGELRHPEELCYKLAMSDQWPQIDPILTRFRATPEEIYGPRLDRVMLYGSRARAEGVTVTVYVTSTRECWGGIK